MLSTADAIKMGLNMDDWHMSDAFLVDVRERVSRPFSDDEIALMRLAFLAGHNHGLERAMELSR